MSYTTHSAIECIEMFGAVSNALPPHICINTQFQISIAHPKAQGTWSVLQSYINVQDESLQCHAYKIQIQIHTRIYMNRTHHNQLKKKIKSYDMPTIDNCHNFTTICIARYTSHRFNLNDKESTNSNNNKIALLCQNCKIPYNMKCYQKSKQSLSCLIFVVVVVVVEELMSNIASEMKWEKNKIMTKI